MAKAVLQGKMKEQEGEESRRKDDKIASRNVGNGRQGMVERYCCNVICGASTTSDVMGLR